MSTKKKSKLPLLLSGAAISVFLFLMVYAMSRDPNALPSQLVGKPFPAFAASTAQGGSFDLTEAAGKGRWVVINFWSTTCIVCREEAPELERFYRDMTLTDVSKPLFVSVNIQDTNESILGYARDYALSFPIVADRAGKISLDFGVTGTPETFFIDPQGTVRHRVAGAVDGDTILRFIDWLEKNPGVSSQDALAGFTEVRRAGG
ncbi:MAG: TlpA family protein disulfide reductase [Silvanigrellales bacterium]|nr:TlpA family protein disulfide reductase [Silvanigrellales bacterium]